jgi:hypothetical protein
MQQVLGLLKDIHPCWVESPGSGWKITSRAWDNYEANMVQWRVLIGWIAKWYARATKRNGVSDFKLICKRPCAVGYLSRFIAFCVIYLFLSSIDKNLKEKKKVSKEKRKKKGNRRMWR